MSSSELDALKDIPGYKAILKSVLKSQIQMLIEQLSDQTGEESIILTASVNDGTLTHLGSCTGKGFLEGRDEIKSQFLGYCLKTHHKKKTQETRSPYQRSNIGSPRFGAQHSYKRPRIQQPPSLDDGDGQLITSDTGQSESFKQESSEVSNEGQDEYNPSDSVSFPASIKRSHTQTLAEQSDNGDNHSDSRTGDNSNDSASANIKIEPITENEMELEITGVEHGAPAPVPVTGESSWGGDQMYASPGVGDPLNQSGGDPADYNYGRLLERHMALLKKDSPTREEERGEESLYNQARLSSMAYPPAKPDPEFVPFEAKHRCEICGRMFLFASYLERHMLSHTGEKPFTCPVCDKRFTRRSVLNKHLKTIHREMYAIIKAEAEEQAEREEREKHARLVAEAEQIEREDNNY